MPAHLANMNTMRGAPAEDGCHSPCDPWHCYCTFHLWLDDGTTLHLSAGPDYLWAVWDDNGRKVSGLPNRGDCHAGSETAHYIEGTPWSGNEAWRHGVDVWIAAFAGPSEGEVDDAVARLRTLVTEMENK